MGTVNGAVLMARELKKQGVDYMFGIVGFPVQGGGVGCAAGRCDVHRNEK